MEQKKLLEKEPVRRIDRDLDTDMTLEMKKPKII
jgi:hypothetical protein